MDFREFKTGPDDTGRRLDRIIRILIPTLSLASIYKSIRKGLIKVNKKNCSKDYRINDEDIIQAAEFLFDENTATETPKVKTQINATEAASFLEKIRIFENEHIAVFNKPAGINVHSADKNDKSLQTYFQLYYEVFCNNDSVSFRPGPLHRIDKNTSGLVCFSKSNECAVWFGDCMKEHKIIKTYAAILQGNITQTLEWQDYLIKEDEEAAFHTVKVYSKDDVNKPSEAKLCITKVFPVKTFKSEAQNLTYCNIQIETGRQHQIRAQASFHGFPLWGDTAYGGKKTTENKGCFYLCAYKLELPQNKFGIPTLLETNIPF